MQESEALFFIGALSVLLPPKISRPAKTQRHHHEHAARTRPIGKQGDDLSWVVLAFCFVTTVFH